MRRSTFIILSILAVLVFTTGAGNEAAQLQTDASEYFEEWGWGTAGWFGSNSGTVVEQRSTGGNPWGYLHFTADENSVLGLSIRVATDVSEATGDYAAAHIAGISFDLLFIESPAFFSFQDANFRIQYQDSGGVVQNAWRYPLTTDFPLNTWTGFEIPLDNAWSDTEAEAAGWVRDGGGTVSFQEALTSVYRPEVSLEVLGAAEAGIDNFRLRGGPMANAGPDQFVSLENDVQLDASGSYDPSGGGLVSFSWREISGRPGCNFTSEDMIFDAELPGFRVQSYVFELEVCNLDGDCGKDTVVVNHLEDSNHAVFVSNGGSDAGQGTPNDPLATLDAAVLQAGNMSPTGDVYVHAGIFMITNTVAIRDSISMYGGYSVLPLEGGGSRWMREPGQHTVVGNGYVGPKTVLSIENVDEGFMAIDGFRLIAGEGWTGTTWPGENSTGIYVLNTGSNLQISNNIIEAGIGGDGKTGVEGEEGWPGSSGSDGLNGIDVEVNTATVLWEMVAPDGEDLGLVSSLTGQFRSVEGDWRGGWGAIGQNCSTDSRTRPRGFDGGAGGGCFYEFPREHFLLCVPVVAPWLWNPPMAQIVGTVYMAEVMSLQFSLLSEVYSGETGGGARVGYGAGGAPGGWGSSQELGLGFLEWTLNLALPGEYEVDFPDVIPFSHGRDGGSGQQGSPGRDGSPGMGGGNEGLIENGIWVGTPGTPGIDGENGGGGGGGGAGHFGIGMSMEVDLPPLFSAFWLAGGTGGGGGGGGCAGDGGGNGLGGGGSFGIFLMNSEPLICNNFISTAGGGRGGDGKVGKEGGEGGSGGSGGDEASVFLGQFHSGDGGEGGIGGDGGWGGNGGGGGGGASVGIYAGGHLSRVIGRVGDNDFDIGPGGQGGAGGQTPELDGAYGLSLEVFPEVSDYTDTTYTVLHGMPSEGCIPGGGFVEGGNLACREVPGDSTVVMIAGIVSTCCRECFDGCTSIDGIDLELIPPGDGLISSSTSSGISEITYQRGQTFIAFQVVNPEPGMWSIEFTGNDVPDEGLEVSVKIDLYEPNLPPIAFAGGDSILDCGLEAGTQYVLDGSASRDGDSIASALRFEWHDSGRNLVGTTPRVPVDLPLGDSMYYLSVYDNWGASASDTISITVQDTMPPVIRPPSNVIVAPSRCDVTPADDPQLQAFFDSLMVNDRCDDNPYVMNDAPPAFSPGLTPVVFTATDGVGNVSSAKAYVNVEDTVPPTLEVVLNRDVLWPPNHQMANISASVTVTDQCETGLVCRLVSVTSNEKDNGKGDGNTTGDIAGAEIGDSDLEFQLRAERSGMGDGRVYTVIYGAFDAAWNATYDTSYVRVPHDLEGMATASLGFNDDGTGFETSLERFVVVLPSRLGRVEVDADRNVVVVEEGFNATRIDPLTAFVGNLNGVVAPLQSAEFDNNGDGLKDLVLFYGIKEVQLLINASRPDQHGRLDRNAFYGPVGLHFTNGEGADYLVSDIFTLGPPEPLLPGALPVMASGGALEPEEPTIELPMATALKAVYPNPFNPSTTVAFDLVSNERVDLKIFNTQGKLVRNLKVGYMSAGLHQVVWNGRNNRGQPVAAGVYFVRMVAGSYQMTQKMVLLK